MPLPRLLINEDSPIDQRLLLEELKRARLACETCCVTTREEFVRALDEFGPDLVITDYFLGDFDGLQALELVQTRRPQTPVVVLTNALNEETAVECMKRGAADYVLKNRLARVVPTVTALLERQHVARERIRLERQHEQLFQLTPNLFCLADLGGTLQEVNPAWTKRLGFAPAEVIGQPLVTLVHADDRTDFAAWWRDLLATKPDAQPPNGRGDECECRLVHRDGSWRTIVWNATPFPAEDRIYAYGHDVTEHKRIETALRESEARFRAVADSAPVLIWVSDPARRFTYFSRPWLEFTGRSLADELDRGWESGVHPEDLERCLDLFAASFEARQSFRMIYRLRRHDNTYRWILDHGTPRYDEHGGFVGYIGSCVDITDQHEAENALTQRAVKQTALVNFGSFALARHPFSTLLAGAVRTVADTLNVEHSHVLELSPDGARLLVAASANLATTEIGQPFSAAIPAMLSGRVLLLPDDADLFPGATTFARLGVRNGIAVVIGGGEKPFGLLTAAAERLHDFTGDTATFLQSIANILSTVYARTRAEAALAESEQKLLQSQKMEAVGLLAGGVAHDFNNLLTAIRCYAEILSDDLSEQAPAAQPKVAEILKATTRAGALTRQLLAFSRKQVVQPEVLDLNLVITDLLDLLRSLLSENIVFDLQLNPQPVNISADRSQIEQVLINLAINARDAMPQGGRLTLRTLRRTLGSHDEDARDLAPGLYAELAVSDSGVGMSADVQAHLFEPFFTTKPKGRGTGLGLATCAVILKNAGGVIRCTSHLGEGTTFHVLLPEVTEPELHLVASEDETPLGRYESILLVEDDDSVRAVTQNILHSLGYEVHAEPGGAEALALCLGENAPRFDLLLTDIVMPYIGGHELAGRLAALRPDMKVMFMSGYVDDPIILQAVQESHMPFLEKPFNRTTLAKKVREALENR
jgi:two-component system, cell cycle sensor histidine kinase and response regulator CckA